MLLLNKNFDSYENYNEISVNESYNFFLEIKKVIMKIWYAILSALQKVIAIIVNVAKRINNSTDKDVSWFSGPDYSTIISKLAIYFAEFTDCFNEFEKYIPARSTASEVQLEKQEEIIKRTQEIGDSAIAMVKHYSDEKAPVLLQNKKLIDKAHRLFKAIYQKSKKWSEYLHGYQNSDIKGIQCEKTLRNIRILSGGYQYFIGIYSEVIKRMLKDAKSSGSGLH